MYFYVGTVARFLAIGLEGGGVPPVSKQPAQLRFFSSSHVGSFGARRRTRRSGDGVGEPNAGQPCPASAGFDRSRSVSGESATRAAASASCSAESDRGRFQAPFQAKRSCLPAGRRGRARARAAICLRGSPENIRSGRRPGRDRPCTPSRSMLRPTRPRASRWNSHATEIMAETCSEEMARSFVEPQAGPAQHGVDRVGQRMRAGPAGIRSRVSRKMIRISGEHCDAAEIRGEPRSRSYDGIRIRSAEFRLQPTSRNRRERRSRRRRISAVRPSLVFCESGHRALPSAGSALGDPMILRRGRDFVQPRV